jgi:CBS domain-containing protein
MAEHRIGCAVVTRRGKLAGVFTSNDACRGFADYLEDVQTIVDGDEDAA